MASDAMTVAGENSVFEVSSLAALRLARYEFRLRARGELVLQSLLGSALRGAFGHAWKTVVCAAGPGERAGCFLREVCLRPGECEYAFFKSQTGRNGSGRESSGTKLSETPRPYIFEPPIPPLTREVSAGALLKVRVPRGGDLPFRMTLLGEGREEELINVVAAVALMAKRGLGAARVPFALERVAALDEDGCGTTVYEPRTECFSPRPDALKGLDVLVGKRLRGLPTVGDSLTVRLLTPTRLRADGRVHDRFSFADMISYLSRRVRLLAELYGSRPLSWDHAALLERAGRVVCAGADLWHHCAERYSESRRGKIEQGGLLGGITYRGGSVGDFLPLLLAGEFLHVGSGTSFGLGCYRVFV